MLYIHPFGMYFRVYFIKQLKIIHTLCLLNDDGCKCSPTFLDPPALHEISELPKFDVSIELGELSGFAEMLSSNPKNQSHSHQQADVLDSKPNKSGKSSAVKKALITTGVIGAGMAAYMVANDVVKNQQMQNQGDL